MLGPAVAFERGTLWRGPLLPRGRLARIVWANDTHVWALEVSGKFSINYPKNPVRILRSHAESLVAAQLCERAPETVRTVEMAKPDSELDEQERTARDQRFALIAPLVEEGEPLESLLDHAKGAVCIKRRMEETGTTRVRLRRLLCQFFWFGSDRNALLSRKSAQGGPGQLRQQTDAKLGRPTATTLLRRHDFATDDDLGYVKRRNLIESHGVNVTDRDRKRFAAAIDRYWVGENMSLQEAYDLMCKNLYVGWTRNADGKSQRYAVDPVFIPSFHQFRKFATKEIRERQLTKGKVGGKDYNDNMAPRTGSASDITFGPTSVADSDATVIKCNVGTDDGHCTPLGCATVLLTVDRASHAILAFHDFIGPECTQEYKLSIFWALLGTAAYLKAIDCKDPAVAEVSQWGYGGGFFDAVYVDRGAARSRAASDSIVGRLKINREVAPPQEPVMKSVVESLNGILQRRIAGALRAAWNRRRGTRHQKRRDEAQTEAPISRREFREILVAAVAEHNQFFGASHLLTAEMKRDGVRPNPISILRWGEKNIRARKAIHFTDAEIYLNLLESREIVAQRDGILWDKMRFTSAEYERFVAGHAGRKLPAIQVFYDRTDPNRRYWKQSDGTIAALDATLATARRIAGMSADEAALDSLRQRAQLETQEKHRLRKGRVTKTQTKIIEGNDGRPKLPRKPKVAVARRVEHARDADTQRQMAHGLLGVVPTPTDGPSARAPASEIPRAERRLSKLEEAALKATNRLLKPDSE